MGQIAEERLVPSLDCALDIAGDSAEGFAEAAGQVVHRGNAPQGHQGSQEGIFDQVLSGFTMNQRARMLPKAIQSSHVAPHPSREGQPKSKLGCSIPENCEVLQIRFAFHLAAVRFRGKRIPTGAACSGRICRGGEVRSLEMEADQPRWWRTALFRSLLMWRKARLT